MIIDTFEQCERYRHLHPGFAAAFDFARSLTVRMSPASIMLSDAFTFTDASL